MSLLNAFSKAYEKVIKDQIVPSMEKYFSVFICVQEKLYFMKHFKKSYLRVEKNLDNNFAFEAILTESSKAFECIPQDLLIAKLPNYYY